MLSLARGPENVTTFHYRIATALIPPNPEEALYVCVYVPLEKN